MALTRLGLVLFSNGLSVEPTAPTGRRIAASFESSESKSNWCLMHRVCPGVTADVPRIGYSPVAPAEDSMLPGSSSGVFADDRFSAGLRPIISATNEAPLLNHASMVNYHESRFTTQAWEAFSSWSLAARRIDANPDLCRGNSS